MQVFTYYYGVYKKTKPWINVDGVWKRAKQVWINVNGVWKRCLPFDIGNITTGAPGTYTHTFLSDAIVNLISLAGGGSAASGDGEQAENGVTSYLYLNGADKAHATGGPGPVSYSYPAGTYGVGVNTIGGTNINGGGGAGGTEGGHGETPGTPGGLVTGGTFAVNIGDVLTVVVGRGGISDKSPPYEPGDGSPGWVNVTWTTP